MSGLAEALMVAIRTHAGQVDKQGLPYLLHVLRVVEAVSDEAKVVAALHDTVEDGPMTLSEVCEMVGVEYGMDEYQALKALTRWGDSYADYIDRIARWGMREGRLAREVKLADLRDNLGRIPPVDATWLPDSDVKAWASLRARYEKAIETLESRP